MTFKLTSQFDLGLRANTSIDRCPVYFYEMKLENWKLILELLNQKA